MSAAWVCAWPGGMTVHGSEIEAEAEAALRNAEAADEWQRKHPAWRSMVPIAAVAYRVDVEPDVRGEDYWNRARGMAA